MKIVITGASGYVGRQLVPLLQTRGVDLVLVGRDPERLKMLFPGISAGSYEELSELARGYDVLLHLAVLNTDAQRPAADFHEVNVSFLLHILDLAKQAGIARFINVSSTHALSERSDPYSKSKRQAAKELRCEKAIETLTLYLPLVHGGEWPRRLAFLNRLPPRLARMGFHLLAALRPTVHVSKMADFLTRPAETPREEEEVILVDGQEDNLFYRISKRVLDLTCALIILVLFWWVLLLIWILIRIDSSGPGIFAQERVGKGGRIFTCYKFRTMRDGTIQAATHEVAASSVTRIGHFLRRTKLDELPQILNILRNEVSLVGPRPCLPIQKKLIEERSRRRVLELKPGITGLAQINGIAMDDPATLARWDARYRALQSILLDLRILLATALGKGLGDRTNKEV